MRREAPPNDNDQGGRGPEIHYSGTPVAKPELVNGKPASVTHLYMDRRGGQFRWWTERESLTGWSERVEKAREREDNRYKNASADHIPSTVAHTIDEGYSADYISIHYSHEDPRKYKASAGDSQSESGPVRIKYEATNRREKESPAKEGKAHTDRSGEKTRWKKQKKFYYGSGEEKLYGDIGISPAEFKEATVRLRNVLDGERKLRGGRFNSAEYLRSWIEENMKQLAEDFFNRGNDQRLEEIELFQDLWRGWDILAFERFGQQTQEAVLEEHIDVSARTLQEKKTRVSKKAAAILDIMASAANIRHIPGEQEIPVSPAMRQRVYEMQPQE